MDEIVEPIAYRFDWVEYTAFVLTLGISALIGVYFGFIKGGQNTTSEYLFGGKTMSTFPIAMSLISSVTSSNTLLGVPSEVYTFGIQYFITTIASVGVSLVSAYIFLPVFYKLQLMSLYEYFELRFHHRVRQVISILYTIQLITYIPIVIYGPALAINQVSGLNVHLITPLICIICIFYTTVGGFRAVVWADVLQGGMMIVSIIIVSFIGAYKTGGFSSVFQSAYEGGRLDLLVMDLDPTIRLSFWSATIGIWIYWTGHVSANPASIQRYISLPTMKQAKWSVLYLFLGNIFFANGSVLIGLIIYAHYRNCDPYSVQMINRPDQILPFFVLDVANNVKGLPGVFLAGVVCASLSTMSTGLNTLAGTIYEDFVEPNLKEKVTEARASQIIKCLVVLFGTICVCLVLVIEKLGAIIEVSASFGGISSGAILGLFILGMFFPMANVKGAVVGGISSLAISFWIFTGYNIAKSQGLLKDQSLPISTEGCHANITHLIRPTLPPVEHSDVFPLYKLSIFYYSIVSFSTVILVSLIVSYITGPNKIEDVNPDLLSPWIRSFIPQNVLNKYKAVPVKENDKTAIV